MASDLRMYATPKCNLRIDQKAGAVWGMNPLRKKQMDWFAQVLKETSLTASALADVAGISPSTLYRFQNGADDYTMRPSTVDKIVQVSNIEPPGYCPPARQAPANYSGIIDLGSINRLIDNGIAIKVTDNALTMRGIDEGDILIIDDSQPPKPGDVVCAEWHKSMSEAPLLIVRIYEAPYLIAASQDPQFRLPMLVDQRTLRIIGVAIRQLRDRTLGETNA